MRHHESRLAVLVFMFGFGLTASLASAQERAPVAPQAAAKSPAAGHSAEADKDKVSPDTPVITMDGFCDSASIIGTTDKTPCRTVVRRSEFEELAEASGTDSPAGKAQLVAFYVKFSLLAREAQKQGMDKSPVFQRRLELARIQLLGQVLIQDLQAKSERFAPGDVEKYFRENPAQFEQVELIRVYIPWTKFKDLPGTQAPLAETAPEMKLLAEAMYARARAGEDFEALQKEALAASNLKEELDAKLGKMSRDHIRRSHQAVFDLKVGEISGLFQEPQEGYYFYKVLSREMPSFESVKSEVGPKLEKQRMDSWMKNIMDSAQTKVSEQYFGPAAKTFQ